MAADYNIDSPARVEIRGKLLVRLKADMGQENRKVYIDGLIAVAYLSDLCRRLIDIEERADELILLCLREHLLGKKSDKQHLHAVNLENLVGFEKARAVIFQIYIRIDYRKLCAALYK